MAESRDGLRGRLIARLIKESDAYAALYRRLQDAYTRAWNQGLERAVKQALEALRSNPRDTFSASDAKNVLDRMERELGPDAMRKLLEGPVVDLVPGIYGAGGQEATGAAGVDFQFGDADKRAVEVLTQGELHWVGNSWNTHTAKLLDNALMDYFEEGMTRAQLAERMQRDFAGLHERGRAYWELLADHAATKTREIGRVAGYEQAAMQYVQVRAHLDERTTAICRAMHGRIIDVQRLRGQADDYLSAVERRDMEAAKRSWKMHNNDGDLQGVATEELPSDTGMPPYHFRCRTITVAYQEEVDTENDVDRWRRAAYDRRALSREEVGQVVERAKSADWPHQKVARGKFRRHAAELGADSQADYNQAVADLIRRGDRDVYLSMRGDRPHAVFARPGRNQAPGSGGRQGYHMAAVDLSENKLVTAHFKERLRTRGDDVQVVEQPGRGISKRKGMLAWLIGS